MTEKQMARRLAGLARFMRVNDNPMESVGNWMGTAIPNVFMYARVSERCMEAQLEEVGRKRITTFMADLSIGEWCSGRDGVLDTCKNAIRSWKDNEKYMAEFVLCVNWKSWEHHARGNKEWCKFYSLLYDWVRDFVYDYYRGDDEKVRYVWEYLD